MPDFELNAMLEIDDSEVEDVNDELEASVTGGDGDMSPAQRDEQEGIIAGGTSRALAGAAVLTGILSQLKSVTGTISSVFSVISRYLVPAVEVISEILRPINEAINSFLSAPQEALQEASRAAGAGSTAREEGKTGPFTGIGGTVSEEQVASMEQTAQNNWNALTEFMFGSQSADQTDEAKKQQFGQILEDVQRDVTGAFR